MPIDACAYETQIHVDPGFYVDPESFVKERGVPILRTTRLPDKDGRKRVSFDIGRFGGASCKLEKLAGSPLSRMKVNANFSRLLSGHNGCVITEDEFLDGLGILMSLTCLLLENPNDRDQAIDLVPGLRDGGPGFWTYLEIPFHCEDVDHVAFEHLKQLKHPDIRRPVRIWPGETILLEGKKLTISIYFKEQEMVAKEILDEAVGAGAVLRLEARLKEEKLIKYFKEAHNLDTGPDERTELVDGTVEVQAGSQRVVRFTRHDLIAVHRQVFGELRGVWSEPGEVPDPPVSQRKQLEPLGRLLAAVCHDPRVAQPFTSLHATLRTYLGKASGKAWDRENVVHNAAFKDLARRSPLDLATFFSGEAWERQLGIVAVERQRRIHYLDLDSPIEILKAYAPNMEWYPRTVIPKYYSTDGKKLPKGADFDD